jgi:hypothetical protein
VDRMDRSSPTRVPALFTRIGSCEARTLTVRTLELGQEAVR